MLTQYLRKDRNTYFLKA